MSSFTFSTLRTFVLLATLVSLIVPSFAEECVVPASGTNATDDAPAIVQAFEDCGQGGTITFSADTTYYVNSVMNVTAQDAVINIQGTLVWSTDIEYWLNNSLPVGYQNQSTAFVVGGDNVTIDGSGVGTLFGNGDVWYAFIKTQAETSNYPGRPHAITFNGLTNSLVTGVNFLRSQMWTMSIIYSQNVTLENIFVNNSGSNTDGADTIRSSYINFNNWTVYNGDDSISFKGNSTNISVKNSNFYNGLGIAIGSVGQYDGEYEVIQGVSVNNVTFHATSHAYYFKTWTGTQVGYPPNGGGGGLGDVSNMTIENLVTNGITGAAVTIGQCTTFSSSDVPTNCTNSLVQIHDVAVTNVTGTTKSADVASLQCSAVKPCYNIELQDIELRLVSTTTYAADYLCSEVEDNIGFNCTGSACVDSSSTGEC
ncbi:hypothetical protein N0V93_003035 [Gnomoniopsis smithogilvyi]|uniref:Glycoside hydrolase family 28 protein n=1 Tax=Gnomoniopsis smithogilvyi TaxID=1191159 RepID=A0A9W9CY81_9PEZI|nr:hypothetical protein N0V93_003035 [Gnomoniopsis smithogilvyi]